MNKRYVVYFYSDYVHAAPSWVEKHELGKHLREKNRHGFCAVYETDEGNIKPAGDEIRGDALIALLHE